MNENTNNQEHEITRVVEPEVIKMGVVSRVLNIFISPVELMHNIKAYPVFLVPFLLSVVIALAGIGPSRHVTEMMNEEIAFISIERFGFDMTMTQTFDEYGDFPVEEMVSTVEIVMVVAMAFINPLLISFFGTLGVFILSKILRGRATFGQTFSMYMHLYVILALGAVVSMFLMSMTGSIVDMTSLAAIVMPGGRIDDIVFNILSAIAVFPIWSTVLLFFGVKVINEFSTAKSAIIACISYAVSILISAGTVMVTFMFMEMGANAMQM